MDLSSSAVGGRTEAARADDVAAKAPHLWHPLEIAGPRRHAQQSSVGLDHKVDPPLYKLHTSLDHPSCGSLVRTEIEPRGSVFCLVKLAECRLQHGPLTGTNLAFLVTAKTTLVETLSPR